MVKVPFLKRLDQVLILNDFLSQFVYFIDLW